MSANPLSTVDVPIHLFAPFREIHVSHGIVIGVCDRDRTFLSPCPTFVDQDGNRSEGGDTISIV